MPWKTLLVTTDLSEGSRPALDVALGLKRQMRLNIHLLHVVDVDAIHTSNADFAPSAAAYRHTMDSFQQRLKAEASERMTHFLKGSCGKGRRPTICLEVEIGPVVETILSFARQIEADAIVMATHARGGVSHLFLGSVAEHVIHQAPCPIVTTRRNDAPPLGTKMTDAAPHM